MEWKVKDNTYKQSSGQRVHHSQFIVPQRQVPGGLGRAIPFASVQARVLLQTSKLWHMKLAFQRCLREDDVKIVACIIVLIPNIRNVVLSYYYDSRDENMTIVVTGRVNIDISNE